MGNFDFVRQTLRAFFYIGTFLTILVLLPVVRFLFFYATGDGGGHLQSLILGGVLLMMGFLTDLVGLVADLIKFSRQLLEMTLERVRRMELSHYRDDTKQRTNRERGEASVDSQGEHGSGAATAPPATSQEM